MHATNSKQNKQTIQNNDQHMTPIETRRFSPPEMPRLNTVPVEIERKKTNRSHSANRISCQRIH